MTFLEIFLIGFLTDESVKAIISGWILIAGKTNFTPIFS
jgi:hypothetical protein